MVSFHSRLERIARHRWPIAWILTLSMAGVILAVIIVTSALAILQERDFSRQDLGGRGRLLAKVLNGTLADPMYFLDVDKVKDLTGAMESSQDALEYIQVFRADGSLFTDTSAQKDRRGSLATGMVRSVLQTQQPVLEFRMDRPGCRRWSLLYRDGHVIRRQRDKRRFLELVRQRAGRHVRYQRHGNGPRATNYLGVAQEPLPIAFIGVPASRGNRISKSVESSFLSVVCK